MSCACFAFLLAAVFSANAEVIPKNTEAPVERGPPVYLSSLEFDGIVLGKKSSAKNSSDFLEGLNKSPLRGSSKLVEYQNHQIEITVKEKETETESEKKREKEYSIRAAFETVKFELKDGRYVPVDGPPTKCAPAALLPKEKGAAIFAKANELAICKRKVSKGGVFSVQPVGGEHDLLLGDPHTLKVMNDGDKIFEHDVTGEQYPGYWHKYICGDTQGLMRMLDAELASLNFSGCPSLESVRWIFKMRHNSGRDTDINSRN